MKKQFTLTLEVQDDGLTLAYRTMRALLKSLLRGWSIRCTHAEERKLPTDNAVSAEELAEMADRGGAE